MSTRSIIGIKTEKNKGRFIYCHFDGYPKHVGKILNEYYTNVDKVNKLIDLGNISSLEKYVDPDKNFEHTFDNPQPDVVVAYHRDRGEDFSNYGLIPLNLKNVKGLWDIEYGYYFDPEINKWFIMDMNFNNHVWNDLDKILNI